MRREYLFLTEDKIRSYLEGRNNIDNTKDYELAVALLLIKWQIKETGERLKLAIPIKEKLKEGDNLVEVFKKKVDENHDIDIYLVPEDINLSIRKKYKVIALQLKRVFLNGKKSGEDLLRYLNKDIPKKYPTKSGGILMLIFREIGSFSKEDFERVNSALKSAQNYPFERVMFIAGDNKKITLGELTGKWGHKSYTPEEWFSDK